MAMPSNEDELREFVRGIIRQSATPQRGGRVVSGIFSTTGAIVAGRGFTVVHNGTGDYTVTFDTPFNVRPAIALGVGTTSGAIVAKMSSATTPTVALFRVAVFISTSGANADSEINFIAHGA
jgi:hypothetical protein